MTRPNKIRLDVAVYERGFAPTRSKAQGMIMAREVLVNGEIVDKAGTRINAEDVITLKSKPRFVSRGGEKLAGALTDFNYSPSGKVCADVGASTGGFTDCLLQAQAKRVYAIDVGYGQIDYGLRTDERVIVIERTNARYLEKLGEPIDLTVVDASFISLLKLLPAIRKWLKPQADVIALIKPQFEAGRQDVGKGGVIKDKTVHQAVLEKTLTTAIEQAWHVINLTQSPIHGATGNIEFLVWLATEAPDTSTPAINTLIEKALRSNQ
jgi:23S rRNA (cytidine1920-2'-O)/16S rRNA (cytidine1409-2'-O)-methyltransferase